MLSRLSAITVVGAVFSFTGCLGTSSTPSTSHAISAKRAHPCPCLYVVNEQSPSVTVFASGASGNVKPIQDISGSYTQLTNPVDIAVDASGEIYVTNAVNNVVTIYSAGATGNVAPIRDIAGSGLYYPEGIAIDPSTQDIYVANANNNTIAIYAPDANGTVPPIATIEGAATGLNSPFAVTLDASGNIYVANEADGSIPGTSVTVYAAGSTGNASPTQTIFGQRTKLDVPLQLALDSNLNVYVANFTYPNKGKGSLTVYARGANGNVAPTERIQGNLTKLYFPAGVAVDSSGNIYASNYHHPKTAASSITVYAPSSNGNVVPISIIKGRRTDLDGARGITIH